MYLIQIHNPSSELIDDVFMLHVPGSSVKKKRIMKKKLLQKKMNQKLVAKYCVSYQWLTMLHCNFTNSRRV